MDKHQRFLGVGIYTVPEAARLSGVSSARIRRWVRGYTTTLGTGELRDHDPLWSRTFADDISDLALSFRDLQEVRVVDALLRRGVSWRVVHLCGTKAAAIFQTTHPFSSRKFLTDGKTVITDPPEVTRSRPLLDLATDQLAFRGVLEPILFGIEFSTEDEPLRWWPLGMKRRTVVVDPERSFGTPIVDKGSVPTRLLAKGVEVEGSVGRVARWYGVSVGSVEAALEFERGLAAA
jgi:uncharacterized protein (DUF433 family)